MPRTNQKATFDFNAKRQQPAPTSARRKAPPARAQARQPAPETARQRFLRIGQGRMVNAIHAIRLVGNLSATHYEVRPEDVALMHGAIMGAVDDAFARFQKAQGVKLEDVFKLTETTEH